MINNGDYVIFDFSGYIDDVQFPGGTAKAYGLEIGSGRFIPGFEEQMIGMSNGETKDV
jgi:trigger factor